MDIVQAIGAAATAFWGLSLGVRVAAAAATFVRPVLARPAAASGERPAVSVVVPVRNLEPELEQAFASVLAQDYPAFEVLIAAAEETSPAIETARGVAARFPNVPARFLLANQRFTHNPKISNLAPAMAAAKHDLILVKDANIQLTQGQLGELVADLAPGTGMVCDIPIAVRPQTFAAEIECAMMNGHAAPLLVGAAVLRLDVGFGKVMLFRRRDFERVDGVAVMAPTFGDDHALAKAFARIGLRTVFARSVIEQAIGARSFDAVWDRQLRWMVIRRDEAPAAFVAEPLFGGLVTTLAGAAGFGLLGAAMLPAALATPLAWLVIDSLVVAGKGWGWSWRYPLAALCREFVLIALWLRALVSRDVLWQGDRFPVGAAGDRPREP